MDSSLASSTASGAPAPRPRPDATLPSFAQTFQSADYDQPPPGISHGDWARLARQGTRDDDDSQSLLDEQPAHSDDGQGDSGGYAAHYRAGEGTRVGQGARRQHAAPSASSFPSSSHDDSLASSAQTPSADLSTASTEVDDRTETTTLLSARLAADSVDLSSRQDDSSLANVYGDGALGARSSAQAKGKGKATHGVGQNMTLREQEKVIDELKKDNFSLKLKLHFYEQRLEKLAPSSVEQALRENIQLKVEFQTLRTELKRYKKLLLEGDRAIQALTAERDDLARGAGGGRRTSAGGAGAGARERELEKRLREQEDAREQWERKARELHRENKQLRAEGGAGGAAAGEVEETRAQLAAAEDEADQLRRELADAHDELDELRDEAAHMRHELADQADQSGASLEGRSRGTIRREVERLEQLAAQLTMLSTRNDEAAALRAQVEDLKADLAAVENELELAQRAERNGRGGAEAVGEEEREALEKDLDAHRDRATSLALELEDTKTQLDAKEHEIEDLLREIDERDEAHQAEVDRVAEEWREEVEGAREREGQARQVLEEKEADLDELADKVEALVQQLAEKDAQLQAEQDEVDALTHDLQKLGGQVFQLEEELDEKERLVAELQNELDAVDKELKDKDGVHEQVVAALKEKLTTSKARLSELTIQHESSTTEAAFLRSKVEDLALAHAKLDESSRAAQAEAQRLRDEADEVMRALRKEEDEREAVEADLAAAREKASDRERDVADLQRALNGLERSSRQMGDAASSDRVALGVELERAKRDLARAEAECEARAGQVREKDLRIATLESEKKELQTQLASQTQARLALEDKHDVATKTLRDTQHELSSARDRLRVVEDQLNTDHRALSKTENQYRDQLAERNTLLLTVFQAVDRIGAADKRKPPASPGLDTPKPFSNFPVFHERLLERLRAVNGLQHSFERRTRELEARFVEQLGALKRQQDARHKQLDRFEAGLKSATEAQRQWRARVQTKTQELEAAKAEVASLQSQLRRSSSAHGGSPNASRSPNPGDGDSAVQSRLAAAQASVSTLERRLAATQAQLRDAEARLGEQRGKYGVAEGKWEARVRELEQRVRAAEEKVKRERQGAKERMEELRSESRRLEHELSDAQRRGTQLDDVLREQRRQAAAEGGRPGSRQSAA
ncbi:hypothetical protein JCM10449v2_007996 [Rhodotorula kratochvilovae]